MPREIQTLLASLKEAYKGPGWHGPSLRAALRGLTAKQAAQRLAPGRHNIWEITVHATYWKFAVRRQLLGGTRGVYNEEGRNWFVRPAAKLTPAAREKSWQRDLSALHREHSALVEAVSKVSESQLHRRAPKSKYTPRQMIGGVAFHDIYHAGQIQLLKRLNAKK
jgi:DinB superfamily